MSPSWPKRQRAVEDRREYSYLQGQTWHASILPAEQHPSKSYGKFNFNKLLIKSILNLEKGQLSMLPWNRLQNCQNLQKIVSLEVTSDSKQLEWKAIWLQMLWMLMAVLIFHDSTNDSNLLSAILGLCCLSWPWHSWKGLLFLVKLHFRLNKGWIKTEIFQFCFYNHSAAVTVWRKNTPIKTG